MRAASTSRPSTRSAQALGRAGRQLAELATGSHSACHGPAARWCSWSCAAQTSRPARHLVRGGDDQGGPGRGCACAAWPTSRPALAALAHLGHLGLAQAITSVATLPMAPAAMARAEASSAIRASSCATAAGERPARAGRRALDHAEAGVAERGQRARGPAELHRQALVVTRPAARASTRPTSQRRGREAEGDRHGVLQQRAPGARSSRCAAASVAAAVDGPARVVHQRQRPAASSMSEVSMTSWLVAPRWTAAASAGTAARRSATSGITGVPAAARRPGRPGRSARRRQAAATASAPPGDEPGVGQRAPARPRRRAWPAARPGRRPPPPRRRTTRTVEQRRGPSDGKEHGLPLALEVDVEAQASASLSAGDQRRSAAGSATRASTGSAALAWVSSGK